MNPESILPAVPKLKTNRLAVASLVLGILSLLFCSFSIVFAIPGLICGIAGLRYVKNSRDKKKGRGFALTGTMINGAILVGSLLASVVLSPATRPRRESMRRACISDLKTIDAAKATWALENKKKQTDTPMDSDLFGDNKYLRDKPICPAGGIYTINAVGSRPTCTIPDHTL